MSEHESGQLTDLLVQIVGRGWTVASINAR
jgi:hypothetical protein